MRTTNSPPEPASELEFCLRHSDPGPSVNLKTGLARKNHERFCSTCDEVCLGRMLTRPLVLGNFSEREKRRSGIELRQKGLALSFQRGQTVNLLTLAS